MQELLKDPMFFYSIAFVIFLALVYRYGRQPILAWIDGEILKVRKELDEAKRLRAEAEATLQEYKARQELAMAEAEAIIRRAQDDAAALRTQAENDLKKALENQEKRALECIRLAEAEAVEDVRRLAIHEAVSEARAILKQKLDGAAASRLMDVAIDDLPQPTRAKIKAA